MKLVPVVTKESAKYFCKNADGTPATYQVHLMNKVIETGFIRTGMQLSFLGISQHQELFEEGHIDCTDSIAPDVRVSAIVIGTAEGVVDIAIPIPEDDLAAAALKEGESYRILTLDFATKIAYKDRVLNVQLVGKLDTQIGTLEVHAVNPNIPNSDMMVIGYALDANRTNSNRRRVAA